MLPMTFLKALLILGISYVYSQHQFAEDCVKYHNEYRRLHGVPDLKLNPAITAYAQEWANKLAGSNKFEHRPNNKYGENLYMVIGASSANPRDVVKAFYDEIKYYNFNNPGFSSATGHFTQVIWKATKEMGCTWAKSGNRVVVVVNYSPAGNVIGQFPANVPRKK